MLTRNVGWIASSKRDVTTDVASPPGSGAVAAVATAVPITKQAGGKTRLLPELLARMPATYRRFVEPFIGGGALFFKCAPAAAIIGDANHDLINMYVQIRAHAEDVMRHLDAYRDRHIAEPMTFYRVRDCWNDPAFAWSGIDRAAAFIYLNKTCFNGLWRVNRRGLFNTPSGKHATPTLYRRDEILAARALLDRCSAIVAGDFADTCRLVGDGDFVFLDCPYDSEPIPGKGPAFTSYNAKPFDRTEQIRLAALANELRDRGAFVMLSNADTPFIRTLFGDHSTKRWKIEIVQCGRSINSKADGRAKVGELLITGDGKRIDKLSRTRNARAAKASAEAAKTTEAAAHG